MGDLREQCVRLHEQGQPWLKREEDLVGVVLWGSISGAMLPFILRRFGFDPASASAPLVATLVDVTGLIIYFTMAKLMLGALLG